MEYEKKENCKVNSQKNYKLLKNMFLLLFGRLISLFGSQIYTFAIGLYVLKTTGSGMAFSGTLIFATIPRVIFGPIAGVISDRLDRKKIVVGMDILSGLVVLILVIVSSINGFRLSYIYATNLFLNTFNTFFDIPFTASIPNIVDDKRLMRTNSFNQSITSIAQIGGPFIGGIVFAFVNMKIFLIINAASFIFSGISEMFIDFNYNKVSKTESQEKNEIQNKNILEIIWSDFREGFLFLRSQNALFMLCIFSVFLNFFVCFGITVPYPYIINNVIKLSSKQFGILEGIFPLGMLVGALIMGYLPEKQKKYKALILGIVTMDILIIMIGIPIIPRFMILNKTNYFIYFIIILFISGISNVYINLPIGVIIQREVPDKLRGRVLAMLQTICMAIIPLGMILSGIIIDKVDVWVLPVISGIILLVVTFIMTLNSDIRKI